MAPPDTICHKESLKLKEIFGTREGFEICPYQLSPGPIKAPFGSLALASQPVWRPVGGSHIVHHRVVVQGRRLLQGEGVPQSVHACRCWHRLAVPDVSVVCLSCGRGL